MKKREFVFLDGGLGNQMFQYAFANKEEMEGNKVSCCYGLLEKRKTHNGYELERVFRGIKAKRMILATYIVRILYYLIYIYKTTYTKKVLNFISWDFIMNEEEMATSLSKNCFVVGYWASWMNVRDVSIFKFREDCLSGKTRDVQQSATSCNSVSLHVRRGDYLSPNNQRLFGGICTTQYYEKSISYIREHVQNPVFYVFSNDIPWVQANLPISDAVYVKHNTGKDSWQDMYLMSRCKHHIIANSTFSWWGAYLGDNEEKIVVCPSKMTNIEGDSPNLFPDEWIRMKG